MSGLSRDSATIELRYDNDQQKVLVVDDREDRFLLSVTEAVRACRVYDQLQVVQFTDQFQNLLNHLGNWLARHASKVSRAVLTTRDAGLLFIACTRNPEFDEQFEDELTSLDLAIARSDEFKLIRLSVMALPDDSRSSIDCFADPSGTWTYAC